MRIIIILLSFICSIPVFAQKPLVLVYGSLSGDNVAPKIKELIDSNLDIAHIFLHEPHNPRVVQKSDLRRIFIDCGFEQENLDDFESLQQVIKYTKAMAANLCVCGSLYTVGEIRSQILSVEMDPKRPDF